MDDTRYWIAINGPSCSLCAIPLCEPLVTPTPEQLFGFPTLEEAEGAQQICLNAPMKKANRYLRGLSGDITSGRIRHIRPKYPQPPSKEATAWTENDDAHEMMQRAFITGESN
jgi:hypothetical protein